MSPTYSLQPSSIEEQQIDSESASQLGCLRKKKDESLVNALLTKESEIAALKEVIDKWRTRALEAEAMKEYYCERFETVRSQFENEIMAIEEEYVHRLSEKDEIIFGLKQELHYLVTRVCQDESVQEEEGEDVIDEYDNISIIDSIYDRDIEQGFVLSGTDRPSCYDTVRSEDILGSIQSTVKAIEQELGINSEQSKLQHRRSLSASTLIEAAQTTSNKKKSSSFYSMLKVLPKILKKQTYPLIKKNNNNNDVYSWKQTPSPPIAGDDQQQLVIYRPEQFSMSNTDNHPKTVPV
ncbi:hypothetical protein RMATCC62417_06260 [Rhizopus microsporus]|nr:hypothetical protein RMATCC62417_06260 [Rhizopus microsporus]CEI95359.1 hypothetical protein RMCBS344292_09548 [Rhizopus microsporus]